MSQQFITDIFPIEYETLNAFSVATGAIHTVDSFDSDITPYLQKASQNKGKQCTTKPLHIFAGCYATILSMLLKTIACLQF